MQLYEYHGRVQNEIEELNALQLDGSSYDNYKEDMIISSP